MGNIAMAANTLRQRPDQNIATQVQANRQQRDIEQRSSRTAQWLAQQPGGEVFVEYLNAGADPAAVLQAYQKATSASADATAAMQNYGEYQRILAAQGPEAAREFLAMANPGGNIDIDLGGGGQTAGWKAVDEAYAEIWLKDSTAGLADVASQAASIGGVLEKLEAGENLTGAFVGIQNDFVRAITNPEAQDAKDRVEQVVQRSLKETLGAQFAASEGDRLIARAYNPSLPPAQNAARLRALFLALQSTAAQKQAMRGYFNENGTLQGFTGNTNIPTIDDFIGVMDNAAPGPVMDPNIELDDILRKP